MSRSTSTSTTAKLDKKALKKLILAGEIFDQF
jgi:hypothetical protein